MATKYFLNLQQSTSSNEEQMNLNNNTISNTTIDCPITLKLNNLSYDDTKTELAIDQTTELTYQGFTLHEDVVISNVILESTLTNPPIEELIGPVSNYKIVEGVYLTAQGNSLGIASKPSESSYQKVANMYTIHLSYASIFLNGTTNVTGDLVIDKQSGGNITISEQSGGNITISEQSGGNITISEQSGGNITISEQSGGNIYLPSLDSLIRNITERTKEKIPATNGYESATSLPNLPINWNNYSYIEKKDSSAARIYVVNGSYYYLNIITKDTWMNDSTKPLYKYFYLVGPDRLDADHTIILLARGYIAFNFGPYKVKEELGEGIEAIRDIFYGSKAEVDDYKYKSYISSDITDNMNNTDNYCIFILRVTSEYQEGKYAPQNLPFKIYWYNVPVYFS